MVEILWEEALQFDLRSLDDQLDQTDLITLIETKVKTRRIYHTITTIPNLRIAT